MSEWIDLAVRFVGVLVAAAGGAPAPRTATPRDRLPRCGLLYCRPMPEATHDLDAVLAANFKRVEQSLRSLEEYSKTLAPHTASMVEQLRYRVYTLERVVDIARGTIVKTLMVGRGSDGVGMSARESGK
mgnify:CR=1 FL=1